MPRYDVIVTTKGGLGGNWTHTSGYKSKKRADTAATVERKRCKASIARLKKRRIRFTCKVKVEKAKGYRQW